MLTVNIVCVGTLKERFLKDGCDEYIKRLRSSCRFSLVEVKEERGGSGRSVEEVLRREAERIDDRLLPGYRVMLCIEGETKSSEELSEVIASLGVRGVSTVNFVIGGSFGLDERLKETADLCLSLSKMTFPHQLFRLMFLEQLYRVFEIQKNSKYHK